MKTPLTSQIKDAQKDTDKAYELWMDYCEVDAMKIARGKFRLSKEDAEDAVAEVREKFVRKIPCLSVDSAFRAWFIKLVNSTYKDIYRKARRVELSSDGDFSMEETPEALIDTKTPEDRVLEIEADKAKKQATQKIVEMIGELSPGKEAVISKFLFEEKNLTQISEELEVNYETVRYRLNSGLDRLRAIIRRMINHDSEFKELIEVGFGEGWLNVILSSCKNE